MDPLTQGVVGASLAQASSHKKHVLWATGLGWVSGMVPDLDVFIRSENDPLLYLEFHRQFTHSFLFIPFGGLICALFFFLIFKRFIGFSFWKIYFYCTLGIATHGLLDAATSYGTQLFWPFTDARIAFNIISIIDPLFTVPLLVLIIVGMVRRKVLLGMVSVAWIAIYMGFGTYQNQMALKMGAELAQQRGHEPIDLSAKPSFANQLVWKVIYRVDETYYVDAVRTGFQPRIYEGTTIQALDLERDFPWLNVNSQQGFDVERFRWFSDGYIAKDPSNPNRIIDLRYSMIPNEINGLWSIELSESAENNEHVDFVTHRGNPRDRFDTLWSMITVTSKEN